MVKKQDKQVNKTASKVAKYIIGGIVGLGMLGGLLYQGTVIDNQQNQIDNQASELVEAQKAVNDKKAKLSDLKEKVEQMGMKVENLTELKEAKSKELKQIQEDYEEIKKELKEEKEEQEKQKELESKFETEDIKVDEEFSYTYTDNDFDSMIDDEVELNGEEYDVHEEISVSGKLGTNLNNEEELEGGAYLLNKEGDMVYTHVFDESVPKSEVSEDEMLTVELLDEEYDISNVGNDEMEVKISKDFSGHSGDSFEYEGNTIKIESVGEDSVVLSVNDQKTIIEEGNDEDFGDVTVKVNDAYTFDDGGYTWAELEVSIGDLTMEIDSGDEYQSNEDWEWVIDTDSDNLNSISVKYVGENLEVEDNPITEGDYYTFPQDYAKYGFGVDAYETATYEISFGECENDEKGIIVESDRDEAFEIGIDEVSEICYDYNVTHYTVDDEEETANVSDVKLVNEDFSLQLGKSSEGFYIGKLGMWVKNEEYFGTEEDESESAELVYDGKNIGNHDYDVTMPNMMVVKEHEDEDEFDLVVPDKNVEFESKTLAE